MHNAKTAGRTLLDYLRQVYPEKDRYMARGLKGLVQFSALAPERASRLRLVTGHFPFGFHEPLFTDFVYFTLLREPVDRVVSFYYYRKRSPQESDYRWINDRKIDLKRYITSGRSKETDNGQVRKISGVGMQPAFGACTHEMLDQAKSNIERHFAVVGLQEQFEETLSLLRQTFEWPEETYNSRNITPGRPAIGELDASTVGAIEMYNQFDMALYEWARERFLDTIAQHVIPGAFTEGAD